MTLRMTTAALAGALTITLAGAFSLASAGGAQALVTPADPPGAGAAPPLTVTVHRDRAALHEGDTVGYRIDVVNHTATDYPSASVIQMVPGGMRVLTADEGGVVQNGETDWAVHLAPGAAVRLAVTAVLGSSAQIDRGQFVHVVQPHRTAPASDGSEFSTTACVRPDSAAHPLACGSDFATLPRPDHGLGLLWPTLATAALAAGLGIVGYRFRRRRARQEP